MLYIVRFLHQTTTDEICFKIPICCISSVSYIKPQRWWCVEIRRWVVYRPFPTSNHNLEWSETFGSKLYIVRFLHQTTTKKLEELNSQMLYIVRFLHQTTTVLIIDLDPQALYIVRFLHQTTTYSWQLCTNGMLYIVRFLHQTTTSSLAILCTATLYIVRFLHQTTT